MENNSKTKIKILFANGVTEKEYVKYLSVMYDVEVLDFSLELSPGKIPSLIVFTGGADVDPVKYGQTKGKYTHIDTSRDQQEIQVYRRFAGAVPLLGICRGAQLLTVLNDGALIQHTTGHSMTTHLIASNDSNQETYTMAGDHHQMMYPFDLPSESYQILYYSSHFKSNTYLNGNNEETVLPANFVEPEIVYYPRTKSLCIQGHPEWMDNTHPTVSMTLRLVNDKLINRKLDTFRLPNFISYNLPSPEESHDEDEDECVEEEDENWL